MISESRYDDLVEQTFEELELALDEVEDDLDYETGGGVLTVRFENGSMLVFSRQPPVRQLWLAAKAGGFHFEYDESENDWRNTRDGSLFRPFVVQQMQSQGQIDFSWD